MKIFILKIIIAIIFPISIFGQNIRPELEIIVKEIEKENVLNYKSVGIAGVVTNQYLNFETLKKTATNEELLQILKNKNTVVKGYASWALADKKYQKLSDILDEFISNNYQVENQNGCIVSINSLAEIFYQRINYQYVYNKLNKEDSLFFDYQIQKNNEIILNKLESGFLFEKALTNNRKNEKTYQTIKKLALKKHHISAIKSLGKYQNIDDIESILKLDSKGFPAIAQFPHESFWKLLKSYEGTNYSENYFLAITAYKNSESEKLINRILEKSPPDSIYNLSKAVMQNYSPVYENILYSIWKKRSLIDHKATKILIESNPKKAADSFTQILSSSNNLRFVEYNHDYGSNDQILPLMFDVIEKYEKDKLVEICKFQIPISEFTKLAFFLKIVRENNLDECTTSIFEKLNEDIKAFEIYHISETLLSFENENINNKLVLVLKEKEKKWNWGNWSEKFKELFDKNKINWN